MSKRVGSKLRQLNCRRMSYHIAEVEYYLAGWGKFRALLYCLDWWLLLEGLSGKLALCAALQVVYIFDFFRAGMVLLPRQKLNQHVEAFGIAVVLLQRHRAAAFGLQGCAGLRLLRPFPGVQCVGIDRLGTASVERHAVGQLVALNTLQGHEHPIIRGLVRLQYGHPSGSSVDHLVLVTLVASQESDLPLRVERNASRTQSHDFRRQIEPSPTSDAP
ncbi:MAG: hypothetical protein J3R72DRAFT_424462 [Linnemannia gamsii]|nr:MAG: hypothetical protein J3R72DRAFT_424462 [Linnemannia gamsii]